MADENTTVEQSENTTANNELAAMVRRLAELEAENAKLRQSRSTAQHKVEIKEHKGARYVSTSGYTVPKCGEFGTTTRGLFIRVEAIDAVIRDLQLAKTMIK